MVVVEVGGLRVAAVVGVVAAAVAQVDPADERDVVAGVVAAADDDELLVVAPAAPDPLVEQDLAPCSFTVRDEVEVRRPRRSS